MLAQLKEKAVVYVDVAKDKAENAKKAAQEATKRGSELIQSKTGVKSEEIEKAAINQEEDSLLDELNQHCKLTKRQRLYGALTCYVLGAIFSVLSTMMLMGGGRHVREFAFFYTVGNLSSIGSSMFLVGPCRQAKVMFKPVRRVAALIWISSMILTIIVALTLPRAGLLVLLLVMVQYSAMLWYGATYIPYGRAMLRKCCKKAASTATSV